MPDPLTHGGTRRVKKSSKQAKSTFIQEGTYGCALTPPLPCKKSRANPNKKEVGKVLRKKNAEIELSIATVIKGIPDNEKYYIIQREDDCNTENFKRLRGQYEKQCKVFQKRENSELLQLISPYGGVSMRRYGITATFDYIGVLRHMLEGIMKLGKQGICHYDLHGGNILVGDDGVFRIIDFGSAFIGDQVDEHNIWHHIYSFDPSYPPQTPEMSVHNGIHDNIGTQKSIEETFNKKTVFADGEKIGLSREEQKHDMVEFWKTQTEWTGDSWVNFYRTYWRKIDSWAVGILFLGLLDKMLRFPEFVNGVWHTRGHIIRVVLRGCLESNPKKRMTAEEALMKLNALMA